MRVQLTSRFLETLRASGCTHADAARAVGLSPTRFSNYVCGTTFGPATARRIVALGRLIGLENSADCVESFRDPLANEAAS